MGSKIQWIVGLSNGETLIENEGVVSYIAGELSPWHKLQKYIKENELAITSLSLVSKTSVGNRHYNLPNSSQKFGGMVPVSYNCCTYVDTDFLSNKLYGLYKVAEAIYEDFKVQLYVSELDADKSWINIVGGK